MFSNVNQNQYTQQEVQKIQSKYMPVNMLGMIAKPQQISYIQQPCFGKRRFSAVRKTKKSMAFKALDSGNRGFLFKEEIINLIRIEGISKHSSLQELNQLLKNKSYTEPINQKEFTKIVSGQNFLKKVFEQDLIIPEFEAFKRRLGQSYDEIKQDDNNEYSHGEIASYIPPLAKAKREWFATGFCSTDSQFTQFGDTNINFSIQSIGKVVAYAFLHNLIGDEVHKWVGEEPSGAAFNAPVFDKKGRPHNPMINAGSIMVCALILDKDQTLDDLIEFYKQASSVEELEVDQNLFLQEFGAMLANNGVNPSTGERIINPNTVQAVVTLMTTCGMYDGAGKFTKDLGVPSKSGVSGGLISVIPGIGAFSTFSPPINPEGNTVRGIGIIHKLNQVYSNFNLFYKNTSKFDVTRKPFQTKIQTTIFAISLASVGDIEGLIRLHNQQANLEDGDYDKRTPLHLASAGGHLDCVKFLSFINVNINPRDRWGSTPLNDAQGEKLKQYLISKGGELGQSCTYKPVKNPSDSDNQFRLLYAAAENRIELIKSIHLQGFEFNSYDYDGRTALHLAASEGHLEIVKYLVAHGADLSKVDARGNCPIADAIRENKQEVVDYLNSIKQQSNT
ncbi:glutaminase kidney mitochondrial-like [Stylonychia lemnae]|uniref:glutaminase n=1 Tax=Stylonychia lemnae TaxID=5949 RepID=A0A078ADL6_STYLE|nr:glutaminase kidney mitochondrial-like [Stylonychia lemnae]|eukprot:CDW79921.1 glutaminase kidney mitochondrial-like [Stylonychia lemnae]